jgi:hypothetical protein
MHYFSYTSLRGMINTPKRFVARGRHVKGVPLQPLTSPHINWLSNLCPRTLVVDMQFSLVMCGVFKFRGGASVRGRYNYINIYHFNHVIASTPSAQLSSSVAVLRIAVVQNETLKIFRCCFKYCSQSRVPVECARIPQAHGTVSSSHATVNSSHATVNSSYATLQ